MRRICKESTMPKDPTKPRHKGVMFLKGIPQTTKADFKAACARMETTMRGEIIKFMRAFIEKAGITQAR